MLIFLFKKELDKWENLYDPKANNIVLELYSLTVLSFSI